jgi:hypothetical protein
VIEGSEEMIQSGHHREAMLWIAAMHWIAHQALQTDAPEEEKPRWQASLHRLFAELGMTSREDYLRRMDEAKSVAERVMERMEEVVYPASS